MINHNIAANFVETSFISDDIIILHTYASFFWLIMQIKKLNSIFLSEASQRII